MFILKKLFNFIMGILETVAFMGSILIVIYLFIAAPHQVKGISMEPAFKSDDLILTSKIAYKLGAPQRGDVVVLKSPKNPDIDYIKRIIGLPGDKIKIENGEVYINGIRIKEDYISAKTVIFVGGFSKNGVEATVPPSQLFVMGDNRPRSSDSREFGFIDTNSVIGKVFFRYFPFDKLGQIKPYIYSSLPN